VRKEGDGKKEKKWIKEKQLLLNCFRSFLFAICHYFFFSSVFFPFRSGNNLFRPRPPSPVVYPPASACLFPAPGYLIPDTGANK
jgi:hypothetical protein